MDHLIMYAVGRSAVHICLKTRCYLILLAKLRSFWDLVICTYVKRLLFVLCGSSRRYPLSQTITSKAKKLFTDCIHGVLLSAEMCTIWRIQQFVLPVVYHVTIQSYLLPWAVPLLVRNLNSLVTTAYNPEHDVSGITVRLLSCLGSVMSKPVRRWTTSWHRWQQTQIRQRTLATLSYTRRC